MIQSIRVSRLLNCVLAFMLLATCAASTRVLDAAQVVRHAARMINYNPENFDRLCFRNMIASAARDHARLMLKAQLIMTESSATLTDDQRQKLMLAGQVDIQRFFAKFESLKRNWVFGSIPQDVFSQQFPKMRESAAPLMARFQSGLHDNQSLYHKTLAKTLTPQEFELTEAAALKRKQTLYRNLVRATVAALDSRLPLTVKQRDGVIQTVLSNTEPMDPISYTQPMLFLVLPKFAEVQAQLEPLFSEEEWPVVMRFINLSGLRKR
jgi:hypothetical protein